MTEKTPEFDAVVEVAHDGAPCFDTKYSEAFWYVGDGRSLERAREDVRNVIIPLPYKSRDEIPTEVVAELRAKEAGSLVLVRQPGPDGERWGLFAGRWPE